MKAVIFLIAVYSVRCFHVLPLSLRSMRQSQMRLFSAEQLQYKSLVFTFNRTSSFSFNSDYFAKEAVDMADTTEHVVKGGTHLYSKCGEVFKANGIRSIGIIGWGSQAPAQAQNLADTLKGSDLMVSVGLRTGSASFADARAVGFSEEAGTLGEMFEVMRSVDMVILLISDAAQAQLYKEIFAAINPGATLGLSHGFLLGYLDSVGAKFPDNINVVAVCPKGYSKIPYNSPRFVYLQC